MFPKSYSNVSWLLCCLIWNHNITATSILVDQSKHDIFYFFSKKSPASVFKVPAAGCYFDPENDCTENKSWVTDKGFKTKWWDNTCKLWDLKVVRCCYLTLGARSFSCAVSSFGKSLYSDLSFSCGFATHVINSASVMLKIEDMAARYRDLELTSPSPPPQILYPNFKKLHQFLNTWICVSSEKKKEEVGRARVWVWYLIPFYARFFLICQHHFGENVVVQFCPWFNFNFFFVLNSLPYITIAKNKGKLKLNQG